MLKPPLLRDGRGRARDRRGVKVLFDIWKFNISVFLFRFAKATKEALAPVQMGKLEPDKRNVLVGYKTSNND